MWRTRGRVLLYAAVGTIAAVSPSDAQTSGKEFETAAAGYA
jgi:hypothetical protein